MPIHNSGALINAPRPGSMSFSKKEMTKTDKNQINAEAKSMTQVTRSTAPINMNKKEHHFVDLSGASFGSIPNDEFVLPTAPAEASKSCPRTSSIELSQKYKSRIIKVGSRNSKLAVVQTESVMRTMASLYPRFSFPLITMSTTGDKILEVSLNKIGEKALFTKELEVALINRTVDFVVHSLKDLPTVLPEGMCIAAVLRRIDPRDVVIMRSEYATCTLATLPPNSVVGTSSVRRIAQLSRAYPHLVFRSIRGNLNTRFRKLDESGDYAAIILAAAGVIRLGAQDRICEYLNEDVMLYAVGQGALAIEIRDSDSRMLNLLKPLVHAQTLVETTAERALMRFLEGGCSVPIGVCSSWNGSTYTLRGMVSSVDGADYLSDSYSAHIPINSSEQPLSMSDLVDMAEAAGISLGRILCDKGAQDILAAIPRNAL